MNTHSLISTVVNFPQWPYHYRQCLKGSRTSVTFARITDARRLNAHAWSPPSVCHLLPVSLPPLCPHVPGSRTRHPSLGEAYCARPGWRGHLRAVASGVWLQEPVDNFLAPITDTLLYLAPLNLKFHNSPFTPCSPLKSQWPRD